MGTNGNGELSQAEKLAIMESFKTEQAEKFKERTAAKVVLLNGVKATGLLRSSGRKPVKIAQEPKPFTVEEVVEEITAEAKAEEITDEAKNADEEEAFKAEAPVPVTDLNPEEQRKRRLIRWVKLKQINDRYAVIKLYGGKCVVATEGRSPINLRKKIFIFQSREAFEQWKANEFVPSLKKRNENDAVGSWWFRHRKRRQYDGVIFKPLAPAVVTTPDWQKLMNTYLGWGVEPKQGDWSLIRRHIKDVLANGDPKTDEYIIRWTAWGIQHPDKLPLVALVLIGYKGRGKGTFARVLERIFGDHSLQISSQRHVVGNFNAHLENLILMISDEAYWAGHKADAGSLQRMITEPTLAIEAKGYDVRNVNNYIHLLMLAEPGWAIPAGQDERRYAVFEVCGEVRGDTYYRALYREIGGDGPAAMLYDLQRMDLGDWHPRLIYKTSALRRQQEMVWGIWRNGCWPFSKKVACRFPHLASRGRPIQPILLMMPSVRSRDCAIYPSTILPLS
jgi:hypothetical protein